MSSSIGYTTREQQDDYEKLPEDKRAILFSNHWDAAHEINHIMQGPKTIEIAGYTILAMPLESMVLTPEQQKKFQEAGGFEVDCSQMTQDEQIQFHKDNPEAPIDWQVSFEILQSRINYEMYEGFDLFKKVYEAFPDIARMTKDEAIEAGLYPIIHYRNYAARKWMAEMYGGYLATLDEVYISDDDIVNPQAYFGELSVIYGATEGDTLFERLAAMGQAPLGGRSADDAKVFYGVGLWTGLASSSLNVDGNVRQLYLSSSRSRIISCSYGQSDATSSVVILNK